MKTQKTWIILMLVALLALWGCSDDDDDTNPVDPGQTDFEAMAEAGAEYINESTQCPGIISAAALQPALGDYTVIDIRSETAYMNGHIPGAYNSSLSTLLDDLANEIPSDKPYVVACYSGQSAGHAKIAMEMAGYDDVFSLLYGMASWNTSLADSWNNAVGNNLADPETTNNNGDLVEHDFPTITGNPAERAAAMLAAGFKGIAYNDISGNLDDYFIINYFSEADYDGSNSGTSGVPGHIPGAFQFTPYASMGMDQMLKYIPTDMPVVVYCWTGQHSSQVTAYLNMLGYEAYSLKNGSNNLFYDDLLGHKWDEAASSNSFDLQVGAEPSEAFETIATAMLEYVNDSADCPGVISAAALQPVLDEYTVIDIRAEDAYNAGHIPGAYHSSLGTLLDDLTTTIPSDKPYVVTCYTGQTAGHAKIAMELMGYEETKSLMFGMCSWNSTLSGSWDANCADNLAAPETDNNNGDLTANYFPTLTGETVASRVEAMIAGGFKGVSYNDISGNLDEYFIINYFAEADYDGSNIGTSGVPGHIPGAFQFTPYASMGMDQMLKYIPTDMPVVVYCWTGQHSSQVTAYLNMLGYEAYSLKFGSNNLFHSSLIGHKWTEAAANDFPLETD